MAINLDELKNASNLRTAQRDGSFLKPLDGKAHVSGERSVPLLEQTIPAIFSDTVSRYGTLDAAVFVGQDKRFTWNELSETVDALAAGFLALGLEKGDRVGIWSPNRWEWLVTQFATARIGLILVNINPAYRLTELEYALNKVSCRALVTAAQFKTSDYLGMIETLAPEVATAEPGKLKARKLPALRSIIRMGEENSPGMFNFADVLAMAGRDEHDSLDRISDGLKPGDAINIQFTSGTTGAPKGATLTHRNIVNNGNFVTSAIRLTVDDRLCIPVPLYHCFGMVMGNLAALTHGATMVYPAAGFDPGATLAAIARERCTALYGVPTMFIAVLAHPEFERFDIASLRTGVMAGAVCPEPLMRAVNERLHMPQVTIAYGMTETSPVSVQTGTRKVKIAVVASPVTSAIVSGRFAGLSVLRNLTTPVTIPARSTRARASSTQSQMPMLSDRMK